MSDRDNILIKPCKKCETTGSIKGKTCSRCSGEGYIFPEDLQNLDMSLDIYEDDLEDEY